MTLFPFSEFWPFYAGFILFVLAVLVIDLGVFHKRPHEITFKEAGLWTAVWVSLGVAFAGVFYAFSLWKLGDAELAKQMSLEFLTGYVVEKSLAFDNIFVFAMIFSYFAVPSLYQHRILFFGIIGALLFRGLFIALGSYLMAYHAVVIFFGALLILTGLKMFFAKEKAADPADSLVLRILCKIFRVQPQYEGGRFFVRKQGVLYATPLFLALMVIEISDIIFAVDSVPAIFALTKEPLIVFTSNIFAILGLRSMYFLIAGVIGKFAYVKYGLAAVLIFVGLKMVWLNELFGGKFPIVWSLAIIAGLVGGSIVYSISKFGTAEHPDLAPEPAARSPVSKH